MIRSPKFCGPAHLEELTHSHVEPILVHCGLQKPGSFVVHSCNRTKNINRLKNLSGNLRAALSLPLKRVRPARWAGGNPRSMARRAPEIRVRCHPDAPLPWFFDRTQNHQALHVDATAGGGRSSAILSSMISSMPRAGAPVRHREFFALAACHAPCLSFKQRQKSMFVRGRIVGARWIDFCSAHAPSWSRRLWRNCACQ
jgi:hypothetical protein